MILILKYLTQVHYMLSPETLTFNDIIYYPILNLICLYYVSLNRYDA